MLPVDRLLIKRITSFLILNHIFKGRLIWGSVILDAFLINSLGGRLIRGSAYMRVYTVYLFSLVLWMNVCFNSKLKSFTSLKLMMNNKAWARKRMFSFSPKLKSESFISSSKKWEEIKKKAGKKIRQPRVAKSASKKR